MFESTSNQIAAVFSNPTWDIVAVLFLWATGFFYGISLGIKKLLAVLFALYLATLLYIAFPYINASQLEGILIQISVFCIFFLLFAFAFSKTVFKSSKKSGKWWSLFLLSFLQTGIAMSVLFNLFEAEAEWGISSLGQIFFSKDTMFFWWLVLPIPLLFIIVKSPKK